MKIYTKQGDDGETGLVGGARVLKDHVRIEAYGTVDELSAGLGAACAEISGPQWRDLIHSIQNQLFVLGAELATAEEPRRGATSISPTDIRGLEAEIDGLEASLAPLSNFILPGGTRAAAALHVARTLCRRAERRVVTLSQIAAINPQIVPYLNRLSDLLFVMARAANKIEAVADIPWRP